MDKTLSGLGTCVRTELALFEAWICQIVEMGGVETAFSCVPTHFNPCLHVL